MNRKGQSAVRSMAFGLILLSGTALLHADDGLDIQPLTPYGTAMIDYKSGRYNDALNAIKLAEYNKPGDPATEILKARILTELGDFTGGEQVLRPLLTSNGSLDIELALGDLFLRKRSFDHAAKYYGMALQAKPNDPDLTMKLVYAEVGGSDLVDAGKYASQLKPLDPDHPSYYFAKAALAQATGKTQEAEDDIQAARTIYGITVTNHYLKTYLEVFAATGKSPASEMTPPPLLKPAPSSSKP